MRGTSELLGIDPLYVACEGRFVASVAGDQASAALTALRKHPLGADKALAELDPPADSIVFVENVGNLVCPALFDLGENARVVVVSVTEGDDKPLKYPHLLRTGDVVLLNKVDLLPYVDFSVDRFLHCLRQVNPQNHVRAGSGLMLHCSDEPLGLLAARRGPDQRADP